MRSRVYQGAVRPDATGMGTGDLRARTQQTLMNIERNLREQGGSINDVVQVMVFVKDMSSLRRLAVRLRHFSKPYTTSTLIAVNGLVHADALIEINAVASVRSQ